MRVRSRTAKLVILVPPLFLILFVLTFPYDLLAETLARRALTRLPFPAAIEGVDCSLPLSVEIKQVMLGTGSIYGTDITLLNAAFATRVLALFKGNVTSDLKCRILIFDSTEDIEGRLMISGKRIGFGDFHISGNTLAADFFGYIEFLPETQSSTIDVSVVVAKYEGFSNSFVDAAVKGMLGGSDRLPATIHIGGTLQHPLFSRVDGK